MTKMKCCATKVLFFIYYNYVWNMHHNILGIIAGYIIDESLFFYETNLFYEYNVPFMLPNICLRR